MVSIKENSNLKSLIEDFIEKNVLDAGSKILEESDLDKINSYASVIVKAFGAEKLDSKLESETKLISSFNSNLTLLIQKTWVESSDADIKDQILYQLEQFCSLAKTGEWDKSYSLFLQIIFAAVYLMFGNQSKKADFLEYAFRVDPEFGILWWYIQLLPQKTDWSAEKCRVLVLLGMYFLANY